MKARKLTDKQEKYKNNRIAGMKVIDSHRDAYPGWKGSSKARGIAANKLEKDPRIALPIDEAKEKAVDKSIMTRTEALQILTNNARSNMADIADFGTYEIETEDGKTKKQSVWVFKNGEDIPKEIAASIKSIKATQRGIEVELHDQQAAIKQLSSMQGWDAAKEFKHSGKIDYSSAEEEELDRRIKQLEAQCEQSRKD